MLVFILESILECQFRHPSSWHPLQFVCNLPFQLRSLKLCRYARRRDTCGSVEAGDGATTTMSGIGATGGRSLTGITTFAGVVMVAGTMDYGPTAMTTSTVGTMASTVAGNR
jgi:hypothetical protein